MLIITKFLQHMFHRFILHLQCSQVSEGLPLWSKTHFSDRLLLSVNSLQSLGSYCGTLSLCRRCAMSIQYIKSSSDKKKVLWMPVAIEGDASEHCQRDFFSFSLHANSLAEDFHTLRSRTRSFSSFRGKECRAISSRIVRLYSLITGGISITNVWKFSKDVLGLHYCELQDDMLIEDEDI